MMMLPRMRTPREAARYIRSIDAESALSEAWIRRAIKKGQLPYVESGNRFLINLDTLEQLLTDQQQFVKQEPERLPGQIRRIV